MVICVIFISGGVKAEKASCESIEELARAVMTARQNGIPMKKLVEGIPKAGIGDEAGGAIKRMIINAYDSPNFNSSKYEKELINEFLWSCPVSAFQ